MVKKSNRKVALKQLKFLKKQIPEEIKKVAKVSVSRDASFIDVESLVDSEEKDKNRCRRALFGGYSYAMAKTVSFAQRANCLCYGRDG